MGGDDGSDLFDVAVSALVSAFAAAAVALVSAVGLGLALFRPRPAPPSRSPQALRSPLSSPCPLSPRSVPLIASGFVSVAFYCRDGSP